MSELEGEEEGGAVATLEVSSMDGHQTVPKPAPPSSAPAHRGHLVPAPELT